MLSERSEKEDPILLTGILPNTLLNFGFLSCQDLYLRMYVLSGVFDLESTLVNLLVVAILWRMYLLFGLLFFLLWSFLLWQSFMEVNFLGMCMQRELEKN